MANIQQRITKVHCFNLAPFFNSLLMYFALVREDPNGELWTTALKCLPIVALIIFVLLNGFEQSKDCRRRSHFILFGLIFSCFGDALLNIDLFICGMISFAIAHIFYISAFGWKPLQWKLGLALYLMLLILLPFAYERLDDVLVIGVPIYSLFLLTTAWRAIVRATVLNDFLSIACALGSVLFVISDALIALTMFFGIELKYARLLIMSTYYAAQLGIALGSISDIPLHKTD